MGEVATITPYIGHIQGTPSSIVFIYSQKQPCWLGIIILYFANFIFFSFYKEKLEG